MFGLEPESVFALSGLALYVGIFLLPFVQEDAAVIAAATASLAGMAPTAALVAVVFAGLIGSDAWKYWLGRLARRHPWAHRFAEKPGVVIAGSLIRREFVQTMLTARFVPGTRIPTYIACGFFKAPYGRYILTLAATAVLYLLLMFGLFHSVGAVAGEKAAFYLPIAALGLLAAYIVFRWLRHRNGRRGPMTPLTTATEAQREREPVE